MPDPATTAQAPGLVRVLVVDDSAVVRRILERTLVPQRGLEVVGKARNGREAIDKVDALRPDVVTMDVEMPEMNGVEAVRAIRRRHPHLPIVMFSTFTDRGAKETIDALMAGATTYVTRRVDVSAPQRGLAIIYEELVPTLLEVARATPTAPPAPVRSIPTAPAPPAEPARQPATARDTLEPWATTVRSPPATRRRARRSARGPRCDLLLVGSSTGGPNALGLFLERLPADFPVPVLVVQHMPPRFTELLADRLNAGCPLAIKEAAHGDAVTRGRVLIAPGGHHMKLVGRPGAWQVALDDGPPVNSCRPAVDVLFESVAEVHGGDVLAVILTGMGKDGRDGCQTLVDRGATVFAQDEASSVVYGMPRAVAEAGLVSDTGDPPYLANLVVRKLTHARTRETA